VVSGVETLVSSADDVQMAVGSSNLHFLRWQIVGDDHKVYYLFDTPAYIDITDSTIASSAVDVGFGILESATLDHNVECRWIGAAPDSGRVGYVLRTITGAELEAESGGARRVKYANTHTQNIFSIDFVGYEIGPTWSESTTGEASFAVGANFVQVLIDASYLGAELITASFYGDDVHPAILNCQLLRNGSPIGPLIIIEPI
jgi:hypothetical protein